MNQLKRQTSARLDRILDAARAIVRESGGTGFTMKDVAVRANVAPATVFNLLGSKDGLLYALLSRSLDDLFIGVRRYKSSDPFEHPVEATDIAVDLFTSDSAVFRELLLVFLGTRDELHRPWFMHRSMMFWRHSVEAAAASGRLPPEECEEDALPRTLMAGFIGSVDLWVHGDLDDSGFRAQSLYSSTLTMLGVADAEGDKRLRARIKDIRRRLPRHHTFLRHLVPAATAASRAARVAVRLQPAAAPTAAADRGTARPSRQRRK